MIKWSFLLLLFTAISSLQAQQAENDQPAEETIVLWPEMVTDRPTYSVSSTNLPANSFQIETGVIFEKTSEPEYNYDQWYVGTTLLRYGVWKRFEMRMASHYQITNGEILETQADTTEQGFGPLNLGFKVHVIKEKGIRPEIAIVADITLRHIGNESYRPMFSYPTARFTASHTLLEDLSLGYNAGFAYNGSNADGFFLYSAYMTYRMLPKLTLFGEVYGNFDHGNLPNHRIDGGLTVLLRHNLQVDCSIGTGFDANIDKSFVNAGLSWRGPR
jgi:hypothetical protein